MAASQRRLWFLVHGWLSLPIWLLFSIICFTGTIAVISHELTWLTNPAARAENPDHLPRHSLAELVAATEQAVPGADIGHAMVLEPYLVTAIFLSTPEMPSAIAYVNPYTATVQSVEQGLTFIGFMRALHGWLLFPWHHSYSIGYYLVSAMSLVVLGAMVSGLVVYKRFWRAFTRPRVRFRRDARTWLGDLHRLGGVWSLWFLLVIGFTGGWYLIQAVLWHAGVDVWSEPTPVPLSAVPITGGERPAMISIEQALAAAQAQLPELKSSWLSVPEHSRDYFSIAGAGDSILFDQYSLRAYINPWTGTVADIRQPDTMNLLQTLTHIADPLHYGTLGGLWTKAIWFVFGLLLSAMSISGFLIYGKRTLRHAGTRTRWQRWRYRLNGLVLLAPCWFLYDALSPSFPAAWSQQAIGPFRATPTPADLDPPYRHDGIRVKDFSVAFCEGCIEQIRYAYINVGPTPANVPADLEGVLHGGRYLQHVHAPYPSTIQDDDQLWINVQEWDGKMHHGAWPLPKQN